MRCSYTGATTGGRTSGLSSSRGCRRGHKHQNTRENCALTRPSNRCLSPPASRANRCCPRMNISSITLHLASSPRGDDAVEERFRLDTGSARGRDKDTVGFKGNPYCTISCSASRFSPYEIVTCTGKLVGEGRGRYLRMRMYGDPRHIWRRE